MTTILEEARRELAERAAHEVIKAITVCHYCMQLSATETVFDLRYALVQCSHFGCSYFEESETPNSAELVGFIGRAASDLSMSRPMEIAALDAVAAGRPGRYPFEEHVLDGDNFEKASIRAALIAEHALRLTKGRERRLVLVGVVGSILEALAARTPASIAATDGSPGLVGSAIHGIKVEPAVRTLARVAEADLAVVTGMTLATDTLDEILLTARNARTKVLVFAQTGAHLADFMVDAGADIVFSEPYPFYLVAKGPTTVHILSAPRPVVSIAVKLEP